MSKQKMIEMSKTGEIEFSLKPEWKRNAEARKILDQMAATLGFSDNDEYLENLENKRLILRRLRKAKKELLTKHAK